MCVLKQRLEAINVKHTHPDLHYRLVVLGFDDSPLFPFSLLAPFIPINFSCSFFRHFLRIECKVVKALITIITKWSSAQRKTQCITMEEKMEGWKDGRAECGLAAVGGVSSSVCVCVCLCVFYRGGFLAGMGKLDLFFSRDAGELEVGTLGSATAPHCFFICWR